MGPSVNFNMDDMSGVQMKYDVVVVEGRVAGSTSSLFAFDGHLKLFIYYFSGLFVFIINFFLR